MKYNALVKIIFIAFLSTLIMITDNLLMMGLLVLLSLGVALLSSASLKLLWKKIRFYLRFVFFIAIVTSVFTSKGNLIFSIGNINILTDYGLIHSFKYVCRLLVVMFSAVIISTSTPAEIIYALKRLRLPYIICFMVTIALRFMPEFRVEYKNRLESLELRGINIDEMNLKSKLKIYSFLLAPTINGALITSEELAKSLYARGFTLTAERSFYREYPFLKKDYIILGIQLSLIVITILLWYFVL